MWVFGYGSLMACKWERDYGCTRRATAILHGYRRVFNKASVVNWGTRSCPCPTLNLELATGATCFGMAFEFPEAQYAAVKSYLKEREGKNFPLVSLEIEVIDSGPVEALVPLYRGGKMMPASIDENIINVQLAHGKNGACLDYIISVYETLIELGIDDPVVTEFRNKLNTPD